MGSRGDGTSNHQRRVTFLGLLLLSGLRPISPSLPSPENGDDQVYFWLQWSTVMPGNDCERYAMTCVCPPLLAAVEWLDQSLLSPGPIMGLYLTGDAPEAHA